MFFADFEEDILVLIPKTFVSIDHFVSIGGHNIGPVPHILILDKEPDSQQNSELTASVGQRFDDIPA